MYALLSLRELQLQVNLRNEAVDWLIKPEKIVPAGVKLTGQPGNVVSAASVDKDGIIIPYQIPYQAVAAISEQIERCYHQIDATSYADLFMAITNMQSEQPRNVEEITSRNEATLTQLGTVNKRVNNK